MKFFFSTVLLVLMLVACSKIYNTILSQEKEEKGHDPVDFDSLLLESLDGPITVNELAAFKAYIQDYNPNPNKNDGNVWVFGNRGKAIEACGLMVEATQDQTILDRMVYYCDEALAGRNDLASEADGGQRIAWTGKVEPIWPSNTVEPAGAGVEQGAVLAHLAFCAKLILQMPSIWNNPVSIGDPHDFGVTYKERALTYIVEADAVIDDWIIPHFVRIEESNHLYFPGPPNEYKPNQPAPWNQLFMVTNALVRLTECHLLLDDAPERIAQYDNIVNPNLQWFFSTLQTHQTAAGTTAYLWDYALDAQIEDANHFAYDAEGLWIAYNAGRYAITFDSLLPFANTYVDVILATKNEDTGKFAGKVDGTTGSGNSGGDTYVRDEYFYLPDFRPDKFESMCSININDGKIKKSLPITARILWQKQRRHLEEGD